MSKHVATRLTTTCHAIEATGRRARHQASLLARLEARQRADVAKAAQAPPRPRPVDAAKGSRGGPHQ